MIGSGAGRADGDYAARRVQHAARHGPRRRNALRRRHREPPDPRKSIWPPRRVTTIAGTGQQNREPPPMGRMAQAAGHRLSSPWDLCAPRRRSVHRHGRLASDLDDAARRLGDRRLSPATDAKTSSTGRSCRGGPIEPGFASFAQPSGLASDGQWLFVADSEGSSIRAVPVRRQEKATCGRWSARPTCPRPGCSPSATSTAAATSVRLQHPLGLAYYEGKLYVADTYNNKIKVIDPATATTKTLVGSATPGETDDPPAFDQPGGHRRRRRKALRGRHQQPSDSRDRPASRQQGITLAIPGLERPTKE